MNANITKNSGHISPIFLSLLLAIGVAFSPINPAVAANIGNGSLIRDPEGHVYEILGGHKVRIHSLSELRLMFAGRVINNVSESVAVSYPDDMDASSTPKALVRDQAGRVYVIQNGEKTRVNSSGELRQFSGMPIHDVNDSVINELRDSQETVSTPRNSGTASSTTEFKNGELVRDQEGRIYVIHNGTREHISSLTELEHNYAGQAIRNINDDSISTLPEIETHGTSTPDVITPERATSTPESSNSPDNSTVTPEHSTSTPGHSPESGSSSSGGSSSSDSSTSPDHSTDNPSGSSPDTSSTDNSSSSGY